MALSPGPSRLECFVEQELGATLAANSMNCVFCKAGFSAEDLLKMG